MRQLSIRKNQKGAILPLILMVVLLLSISSLALVALGTQARLRTVKNVSQVSARFAADAGVERVLYLMNKQLEAGNWTVDSVPTYTSEPLTASNSNYSVSFTGNLTDGYVVTSVGEKNGQTKTVRATIELVSPIADDFAIFTVKNLKAKNNFVIDVFDSRISGNNSDSSDDSDDDDNHGNHGSDGDDDDSHGNHGSNGDDDDSHGNHGSNSDDDDSHGNHGSNGDDDDSHGNHGSNGGDDDSHGNHGSNGDDDDSHGSDSGNSDNDDSYSSDSDDCIVKIGTQSISNNAMDLGNNGLISGDIYIGPDGIADDVVKLGNGTEVTGETFVMPNEYYLPTIEAPDYTANKGSISGKNITLASSDSGKYDSLTINNSGTLKIQDNVTLYITGDIELKNSAEIEVSNDASLILYFDGNLDAKNSFGINNKSKVPSNITLFGTGTNQNIDIKNNADLYAVLYAPDANLNIHNNVNMYGSFIVKNFEQKNGGEVHYDKALKQIELTDELVRFSIVRWEEL